MTKSEKIALFHPWIKSKGGAEKVVLELLEKSKHKFEIYTWVYDKENTFSEFKKYKIHILAPKFSEKFSRMHILRGLFFPLTLFKKIPLEKYEKFLISTSGLAEFITFRNYKKGKTYAYVHTPLRDANKKIINWNLNNRYKGNLLKKFFYLISVKIYKFFEKIAWKKLDVIIFNSELSESRAKESNLLKNQKIKIIYPPIDISRFRNLKSKKGKNFIYISRLNSPKRQDILIKAWNNFSKKNKEYKLLLIGTPDNKEYYQELLNLSKKNSTIKIISNISNKEMDKIIENSVAGIFLGYQEDFGIVPLEIINAKKPLLAVDEGGYVKLIENHPLFYKIKEKHNSEEMVKEVERALVSFVSKKKTEKRNPKKIKTNNFIKKIDEILTK